MNTVTLSDKAYNFLKWVTLIFLPAVSAAYFGLSGTLNLPNAEQVVGVIAVLCTFLGTLLGISTRNYNSGPYDGQVIIEVDEATGKKTYALELNGDPDDIDDLDELKFRVVGER